jgi:hypothetical protein
MKQIILLLCTALFVVSCKEKINSVQDVMTAMAPPEQGFTIDPATDNVIKGEKGTQIFIPANTLKFPDGTAPTGKVKVELKEFFSISDFISNNLSTTSNRFLLETAGMLFISATADGKELIIDKSKSYTIALPKEDSTKEMQTFYGDTVSGAVTWSSGFGWGSEGDEMAGLDSALIDSSMFETKTRVCGYNYSSSLNDSTFIIEWKLKYPDSTIFLYVDRNFPTDDSAVINALCKQGLIPSIHLFLDPRGNVSEVEFDAWPYDKIKTPIFLQKYLIAFLRSLPPFDMRSMKTHDADEKFYLSFCCDRRLNRDEYDRRFKQKYTQYLDKAVENMGSEAINYYIISSARLGWINCDRFLYDTTEKIDYIVKVSQPSDTKVMIVFDDIKSIMTGEIKNDETIFKNIPVSSKIKVIGISYKDGKPLMSKMPAVVSKQPFTLAGFKEFSLKELEKELNN